MASITISNTGGDSKNLRLKMTYTTSAGTFTLNKVETWSTDTYTRYEYDDSSLRMNVKVGSNSATALSLIGNDIYFKANSVATTIYNTNRSWSCSGNTDITITFTTVNTYIDDSKFTTTISVPQPINNPTLSGVSTSNVTNSSVQASFSVTNNGGASITSSKLQISTSSNFSSITQTINSQSGTFTGLNQDTTYYIRGYASNGTKDSYTSTTSIRTNYNAPTINSFSLTPGKDNIQINLSTSTVTEVQYDVNEGPWITYTGSNITNLAHNTQYRINLRCINNNSTWTYADSPLYATTLGDAPVISQITPSVGKTSASLSNISITYDTNASFSSASIDYGTDPNNLSNTVSGYNISNLSPNTTYYYQLNITDNFNRTGYKTGSFTTIGDAPTVDSISITNIGANSATLTVNITLETGSQLSSISGQVQTGSDTPVTFTGNTTSCLISNLSPGKVYTGYVKATDNFNRDSSNYQFEFKTTGNIKFNGSMMIGARFNQLNVIGIKFNGTEIL